MLFYTKKIVIIISQIFQFSASRTIRSQRNEKSANVITINALLVLYYILNLKGEQETKMRKVRREIGKRRVIRTDKEINERK